MSTTEWVLGVAAGLPFYLLVAGYTRGHAERRGATWDAEYAEAILWPLYWCLRVVDLPARGLARVLCALAEVGYRVGAGRPDAEGLDAGGELRRATAETDGARGDSRELVEPLKTIPKRRLKAGGWPDTAARERVVEAFAEVPSCGAPCPAGVLDDWGDPCEGHPCERPREHGGYHRAGDGANGWVRWSGGS